MTVSIQPPAEPGAASTPRSSPGATAQAWSLALFLTLTALVPLGLRLVNIAAGTASVPASYLPSVLPPAERGPFYAQAVQGFRDTQPDYVVIGDSMGGSRINHRRLGDLLGTSVVPIFEPATGSVFWYLAYKNWVVASGVRPKAVIVFFRDENLTDPMFRLWHGTLDRVALDREGELDDVLAAHSLGALFRLHAATRVAYESDRTRAWVEPLVAAAPVRLAAGERWRGRLLERMNNEVFTLAALRPMAAADMAFGDPEKFDFHKNLPTSVLPAFLRLAKASGTRPAFIRVQRRPVNGRPPEQSEALRRYVRDLRDYLQANGAYFHDEWGDPELPLSIYSDGDHIGGEANRLHCTELFVRRNQALFR